LKLINFKTKIAFYYTYKKKDENQFDMVYHKRLFIFIKLLTLLSNLFWNVTDQLWHEILWRLPPKKRHITDIIIKGAAIFIELRVRLYIRYRWEKKKCPIQNFITICFIIFYLYYYVGVYYNNKIDILIIFFWWMK
jgi:hypothetical protein